MNSFERARTRLHGAALVLLGLVLLPLGSCDQTPSFEPREPARASAPDQHDAVAAEKDQEAALEREARIAALEHRVAELEAQIGDMKASREQLSEEMIGQRLATVEAAVLANGDAFPTGGTRPVRGAAAAPELLPTPTPSPTSRTRRPLDRSEVIERANGR